MINKTQITTIIQAKIQFVFFSIPGLFITLSLASVKTLLGISLNEIEISIGTIIKSSKSPITGIKSLLSEKIIEKKVV